MELVDFKEITNVLNNNKIILYPTDTVWGIGCDATSYNAIQKIYSIKKREENKSLIILVSSLNMLKKYVSVPKKAIEIIKKSTKPTTIIYKNPKNIAENIINKDDNSVAIRIVKDDFCRKLIKRLGKPLVSTSANISGRQTPKSFSEIEADILNSVDYIVNSRQNEVATKSSTILKIEGNNIVVLRE
ncbi:MAG: threonylcarbamoyl-AMP synthase [Tenacibaculum sp.]|nr:threonylcarbamoyl-AMP synthase [Tenacibaculum sp.]